MLAVLGEHSAVAQTFVPLSVTINPTHFHCYQVLNPPPFTKAVALRDQFQRAQPVIVGRAALLCAPVQKNEEPAKDRTTHLLCYQIEGAKPASKTVVFTDQFNSQRYRIGNSQLLCVPGTKRVVSQTAQLVPMRPCLVSPPPAPGVRFGTRNLALGADVPAGTNQDIELLVNSHQTGVAPLFQFGINGPTSDEFEVCISTTQHAPVLLGSAVTWTVEDPVDPGKNTLWATAIFSQFAIALQSTIGGTNVNGHAVIKVDISAQQIRNALIGRLNPGMPGFPSGRTLIIINLGGTTFGLHITVGQQ
jgi:hypothetical protein